MAKEDPFKLFVQLCKDISGEKVTFSESAEWQQRLMSQVRKVSIESEERETASLAIMWRLSLATLLLSLTLHICYQSSSIRSQFHNVQLLSLDPLDDYLTWRRLNYES